MLKKVILWVLAVVIALGLMMYQRLTGPTYEKRYEISYEGQTYKFSLPRSFGKETDCPVELELPEQFEASIIWRRFPTEEQWKRKEMERQGGMLVTTLPEQPPAGKLEYHLELTAHGQPVDLGEAQNVVIRYKSSVPDWAQIPHICLMIFTVIFAMATILFALAGIGVYKTYQGITLILLILGAFIFGPIVQKFAFGQFWTGWPLGEDMTDNKVLVALFATLAAWFLREKSYGRWISVAACAVLLAIYLIPHSMNGSELDPDTGQVVTGTLFVFLGTFLPGSKSGINPGT